MTQELIRLKSSADIATLRQGGKILARILEGLAKAARVGVTLRQLNELAEQLIAEAGAKPAFKGYGHPPFPAALCTSVNSCVVHGVPSDYKLKDGDLLGLDCGVEFGGLYTDAAITVGIGKVSVKAQQLLRATADALEQTLVLIKAGVTTGDIGAATQQVVEKAGFSVVRDMAGHGVGYAVHEPPVVPNYGKPGTGERLAAGTVIAIEPMVAAGDWRLQTGDNGWDACTVDGSLTAHFERTVVVTDNGYEDITPWKL
jgi:methionyl aminopeptidase